MRCWALNLIGWLCLRETEYEYAEPPGRSHTKSEPSSLLVATCYYQDPETSFSYTVEAICSGPSVRTANDPVPCLPTGPEIQITPPTAVPELQVFPEACESLFRNYPPDEPQLRGIFGPGLLQPCSQAPTVRLPLPWNLLDTCQISTWRPSHRFLVHLYLAISPRGSMCPEIVT